MRKLSLMSTLTHALSAASIGAIGGTIAAEEISPDEQLITRQQRRAALRRQHKMPIGMSRKEWHRLNGYQV